jgi:hypothetical protein
MIQSPHITDTTIVHARAGRSMTESVCSMFDAARPFLNLLRHSHRNAFAFDIVGKQTAPRRKPRLATLLAQGKKAGATAVTVDGVTYTFGEANEHQQQSDTDREWAEFEARHGKA